MALCRSRLGAFAAAPPHGVVTHGRPVPFAAPGISPRRWWRSRTLFALALAGATACGSSAKNPTAADGSHSIVLGTGEAEFQPLDGEPEITLVHGAQGGFHVWASFLAYGFGTERLDMVLTTSVDGSSDEPLVMHASLTTREVTDAEGVPARTFAGFPAQIRNAPCVNGRRVRIDLLLSEAGSDPVEDARYCIALVSEAFRSDSCP
jgi:hypothetical protein